MPRANLFRHQAYTGYRSEPPVVRVRPGSHPAPGSEEFRRRMSDVGDVFRSQQVAAIYLVHGTLVGPDALGIAATLARTFPTAAGAVRRVAKRLVDELTGDAGNYTEWYAEQLESALSPAGRGTIPVRLFYWSSENHHLGRADGAVRLIDELASLGLSAGQRVLLWGHSHGGNVFALVSNLLAGNPDAAERFFEATDVYYRWPLLGCVDIPLWNRVRQMLRQRHPAVLDVPLDMVTFGTPVRYGWDSAGYARLLHFIHRRNVEGDESCRATFPLRIEDILQAADGDYVQQLGIAGTNVPPSVFAWRAWLADRRLQRLLQSDGGEENRLARFQAGTIVPEEGTTLLVDYGPPQGNIAEHHAGHAVYTRAEWMLFHAEQVARRFYHSEARAVA